MGYRTGSTGGGGGGKYERPDVSLMTPCVLAAYYPAGTHERRGGFEGDPQDKVVLVWELEAQDSKGAQFRMFETVTDSLYGDSALAKRVHSLRRSPITKQEVDDGIDLDTVLNLSGMMYVGGEGDKRWVDKVETLQDANKRVAVRHDYSRLVPRYVNRVLKSAFDGTAPGYYGYVSLDGQIRYEPLPPGREGGNERQEPKQEEQPAAQRPDASGGGDAPDDDIPF